MDRGSAERQVPAGQRTSSRRQGFCCLGVLCDLVDPAAWEGERWGDATTVLPVALNDQYKISGNEENVVAKMNDDGSSFSEIADYIEANL